MRLFIAIAWNAFPGCYKLCVYSLLGLCSCFYVRSKKVYFYDCRHILASYEKSNYQKFQKLLLKGSSFTDLGPMKVVRLIFYDCVGLSFYLYDLTAPREQVPTDDIRDTYVQYTR